MNNIYQNIIMVVFYVFLLYITQTDNIYFYQLINKSFHHYNILYFHHNNLNNHIIYHFTSLHIKILLVYYSIIQ